MITCCTNELSATAPLKVAVRQGGFRAATMPGFLPSMIPALKLDYEEINRRVNLLKEWLDAADAAVCRFTAGGADHELELDLRHRTGHASGGLFPDNGVAGNLPSGEAYIVPYEGELDGDASRSAGTLPVEIDGEVVVYRIEENRAVAVLTEGAAICEGVVATSTEGLFVLPANADLAAAEQELAAGKREILDKLIFRMKAVKKSKNNKYILLNAPNDKLDQIIQIIPGMKSPTVMPLAEKGWSSVHSVLNENEFWEIIDRLRELGAQGILVIPIEKMIT